MILKEENGVLRIRREKKFIPWKSLPFAALAGTIIGIISEEAAAGIAVFFIISIIGFVLTLIEHWPLRKNGK